MSETSPTLAQRVRDVRQGAGLFRLSDRGLLAVRGEDRIRFLDGQLSNDVAGLDPAGPRSGCYAFLLTPQGRIVADLHVIARPDDIWLELAAAVLPAARARLEKYLVADDVELEDCSDSVVRLALEGPRAPDVLEEVFAERPELLPDSAAKLCLAGVDVWVGAWGWSGEPAYQLLVPRDSDSVVEAALRRAAGDRALVVGDRETLEVLRVEAGIPRSGAELDEEVLPAETPLLERAVSFTKGCYTGQEVVARMDSRGRVGHRLVGLSLAGEDVPRPGAEIRAAGRPVGEVTSAVRSPRCGSIALGFVRTESADPGTHLSVEGRAASVTALPFVGGAWNA